MTTEEYIDHEVRIRVQDEKYRALESKLNFILALGITGILVPVILHWLKLT